LCAGGVCGVTVCYYRKYMCVCVPYEHARCRLCGIFLKQFWHTNTANKHCCCCHCRRHGHVSLRNSACPIIRKPAHMAGSALRTCVASQHVLLVLRFDQNRKYTPHMTNHRTPAKRHRTYTVHTQIGQTLLILCSPHSLCRPFCTAPQNMASTSPSCQ